jgi:hypothetical protein
MLRASATALLSFLIFLAAHFTYFHYAMPYEKVKSLLSTAGLGLITFIVFYIIFLKLPQSISGKRSHPSHHAATISSRQLSLN